MRKEHRKLHIDRDFRDLTRPLSKVEYQRLETRVLQGNCRKAVVSWNGIILQGFELYSICARHRLPFQHEVKTFECREDAISWVCRRELQSTRLTEERFHFLLGVCYNAECKANRYHREHALPHERVPFISGRAIAEDLGNTFHVSWGAVKMYDTYSRALLTIRTECRNLFVGIVSGRIKLSREIVFALSKMKPSEVEAFYNAIAAETMNYKDARKLFNDMD